MKKPILFFSLLGAGLWLLSLTLFSIWTTVQKPTIGVIDTHALVALEAKAMTELYPKGTVPSETLQKIADKLKITVAAFAKEQNCIFLAKGAVWGGELPDFTDLIIEKLKEE